MKQSNRCSYTYKEHAKKKSHFASSPTILLLCSQKVPLTSPCLLSVGQCHEWKTYSTAEMSKCASTCCTVHCIPPHWKKTSVNLSEERKKKIIYVKLHSFSSSYQRLANQNKKHLFNNIAETSKCVLQILNHPIIEEMLSIWSKIKENISSVRNWQTKPTGSPSHIQHTVKNPCISSTQTSSHTPAPSARLCPQTHNMAWH